MRIKFVEISNFRKLKSTHLDFDEKSTILVGANNSGKTSAMVALRDFLVTPNGIALRDITIANWTKIDAVGAGWEADQTAPVDLNDLLPALDVWLDVPLSQIQHVVHILPTLEWKGGLLGVRLKFELTSADALKSAYLLHRKAAALVCQSAAAEPGQIDVWPKSLTDFLEKKLRQHIELNAYCLDPEAHVPPIKGLATPQILASTALPLEKNPFRNLIKIDEIAAQRDFADAGGRSGDGADEVDGAPRRFKRRLSDQLRTYYDRHLDPAKTPSAEDYDALRAIQEAERNFDKRLERGFQAAFDELEDLGYPGVNNPKLKITTQLRAIDGLRHASAVQYQVADPTDLGGALRLPEDYAGLGYQNLIAMVFMLMSYRDDWMRVGKASAGDDATAEEQIAPLHLVLVEEPEAHLHAQVQQVFIKKAYGLLRKHPDLGERTEHATQLVVSTHSSHVAHEADFANLRYFRRRPASNPGETPTTTVANLSHVFGEADETQRFVKRYLKATHCDLFFADGVVFVEGQAERILVPHFIRYHFPALSRRYITLLDLGGSHAHKFQRLVDELGLTTLVVSDLDAAQQVKITTKAGVETTKWKAAKPQLGLEQRTSNPVLKDWHPQKATIDELAALDPEEHQCPSCEGYELYVAYQKPLPASDPGGQPIIPRTFEDALILQNLVSLADIKGSATSAKIRALIDENLSGEALADELFELLKSAEKAAFALDCLMHEDATAIKPPGYIQDGLAWFERSINKDIALSAPSAVAP